MKHEGDSTSEGAAGTSASASTPKAPAAVASAVFAIDFVRGRRLPSWVQYALVYIAFGFILLNLIVTLLLFVVAGQTRREWRHVKGMLSQQTSVETIAQLKAKLAPLQETAEQQLTGLERAVALQRVRFAMADKLAAVAKTVPVRTWITGMTGDRERRTLTIHATCMADPASPSAELPMKGWVDALRADRAFADGLKRLEIGASSRTMVGKTEVYLFDLTPEWSA